MKRPFIQTVEYKINSDISPDFFEKLPEVIVKHTYWNYSYQQRDAGCFLKPIFQNMPYRNSFVPEIEIVVSRHDAETMLHISGRPVKFVRFFMVLWFGFLSIVEVLLLLLAMFSELNNIIPILIPVAMCIFAYLLCELGTKLTFHSIVKAIQSECV